MIVNRISITLTFITDYDASAELKLGIENSGLYKHVLETTFYLKQ